MCSKISRPFFIWVPHWPVNDCIYLICDHGLEDTCLCSLFLGWSLWGSFLLLRSQLRCDECLQCESLVHVSLASLRVRVLKLIVAPQGMSRMCCEQHTLTFCSWTKNLEKSNTLNFIQKSNPTYFRAQGHQKQLWKKSKNWWVCKERARSYTPCMLHAHMKHQFLWAPNQWFLSQSICFLLSWTPVLWCYSRWVPQIPTDETRPMGQWKTLTEMWPDLSYQICWSNATP